MVVEVVVVLSYPHIDLLDHHADCNTDLLHHLNLFDDDLVVVLPYHHHHHHEVIFSHPDDPDVLLLGAFCDRRRFCFYLQVYYPCRFVDVKMAVVVVHLFLVLLAFLLDDRMDEEDLRG